jgi:hypothetical protein
MVFAGHARTESRICTLKITHLFSYLPAKNRNGLGSDECCVRGKSSLFNYNVPKYKPKIKNKIWRGDRFRFLASADSVFRNQDVQVV